MSVQILGEGTLTLCEVEVYQAKNRVKVDQSTKEIADKIKRQINRAGRTTTLRSGIKKGPVELMCKGTSYYSKPCKGKLNTIHAIVMTFLIPFIMTMHVIHRDPALR